MKFFVLDPLWNKIITSEQKTRIEESKLDITVIEEVSMIRDISLLSQPESKALCINPDYVRWDLKSEDYKDIPELKLIIAMSTGFEWVNQDSANKSDTTICNIRNFSVESPAEYAIGMMMMLAKQMPRIIKDGFPLDYDKDYMRYLGIELKGKTAGVIGMGNIGKAIASRCHGLGMEVVYWSRKSRDDRFKYVEFNDLMMTADVILPTIASNDETKAMFTDSILSSMKTTAIYSTIDHHIVPPKKLANMVKEGRLFGYGFEAGPKKFDSFDGNVWAAPDYGWATFSTMSNSIDRSIDVMIDAEKGKFPNKVN